MNTLRAQIAALIVAAIVIVVGLVCLLMIVMVPIPTYERLVDINSYYVSIIVKSGRGGSYKEVDEATFIGKTGRFGIKSEPAGGELLEDITRRLRTALHRRNISTSVIVTQTPGNFWPVASIEVPGQGWLLIPVDLPPPPMNVLLFMFSWIAAGTALVAIAVVYRFMRPLALIEKSVANVDPNGELPVLAENGPADIRATARAINRLSSRLKDAMESRMRLVAAAGHDLRTPMTRMRLRAEFLDEADREKWLADLDELDHIADSAIRLVHEQIDDSNGEPVRLDNLVNDVISELKELQLDVRATEIESVQVNGKPLSLKRAIRNLLINAATHGGGATVSIRRNCESVFIDIVDNGPGIPEELLARAFEPFFRVDAARSPMAGAGLGLAIAKEIIHCNRGNVALVNRPGGGLAQTVEIPLWPD
jgi:signal transduction histidine kinase